jgi:hypothetical protein
VAASLIVRNAVASPSASERCCHSRAPIPALARKKLASSNKTWSELTGTGEHDPIRASRTGWQRPTARAFARDSRARDLDVRAKGKAVGPAGAPAALCQDLGTRAIKQSFAGKFGIPCGRVPKPPLLCFFGSVAFLPPIQARPVIASPS